MKHQVHVVLAFVLGGLLTYGIMSWHGEKWGMLVTEIGVGSHLEGVADTKKMCLDINKALEMNNADRPREVQEPVIYSCLPLSQLRGLPLVTH